MKEKLAGLIQATKSDIIFGNETWLKPHMKHGEFFPIDHTLYRKDHIDGYGGVLKGIHNSLRRYGIHIESESEFIAAQINSGKQSLVLGSLYRPPYNDQNCMDEINRVFTDLLPKQP